MYVKVNLLQFTKKQRMTVEKLEFDMVKNNIEKLRNRRFMDSGTVLSLMTLFNVPKVDIDTPLVYNLTACGMNEALWDHKLWITFVENALYTATHSSWFGDVDTDEMFHNYILSEKAQTYAGVDVS